MKFITLDPYYNNKFYNECREALKNNGIEFKEFVCTKAPYNFYFGVDDSLTPMFVNYDIINKSDERYLVNVVTPVIPMDYYILTRKENDSSAKSIRKFVENEPLRQAIQSEYACFFNAPSRNFVEQITKIYPFRVWYMGKYFSNKYRICLTCDESIKNFIRAEDILVERYGDQYKEVGKFEAVLNYKIFTLRDHLVKYTLTPYIENGLYIKTNYKTYDNFN